VAGRPAREQRGDGGRRTAVRARAGRQRWRAGAKRGRSRARAQGAAAA
jgi:hypothetical protein